MTDRVGSTWRLRNLSLVRWQYFILVLVLLAVFHPVLQFGFVDWDDDLHVSANPRLNPVSWEQVKSFWYAPYERLYIPLTYTLWATVVWLAQTLSAGVLTAPLCHALNLLLHLASMIVVYRLGLLITTQGHSATQVRPALAAVMGALLFGIHPLQVEPVAWVSGLRDVLSGFLALVALWQYAGFSITRVGTSRQHHYALATAAFVLALLAKPLAVVVPVLAWTLEALWLRRGWRPSLRSVTPWLVMAIGWSWWTKALQPDDVIAYNTPMWGRLYIAVDTVTFYIGKLLWPANLGPDYGRTPQMVIHEGGVGQLGLLVLGLALYVSWQRRSWCVVGVMTMFVAGLLPVLGFVPFVFQAFSTVADRYAYLALVGPALGVSWVLANRVGQVQWWVSCVLLLGLLGWQSTRQVAIWRDSASLFTHILQLHPQSVLAYSNMGVGLLRMGRVEEALAWYRKALEIVPTSAEVHYNLGNALVQAKRVAEAQVHYAQAVILRPAWAEAHNNLGRVLADQRDYGAAIAQYRTALRLLPTLAEAHNNLGDAMLAQGDMAGAVTAFQQAVTLQPTWAVAYYNLGVAWTRLGQAEAAQNAYRAAVRWQPGWPQATLPLVWLLLQEPQKATALAEAMALAEAACDATGYADASALYALALIYQAQGATTQAQSLAARAIWQAKTAGQAALVAQITRRFPVYTSGETMP